MTRLMEQTLWYRVFVIVMFALPSWAMTGSLGTGIMASIGFNIYNAALYYVFHKYLWRKK